MRIGVISSTVFATDDELAGIKGYGGLEVIAWHCARGLAAKNHSVTFFAPNGSVCPGCQVHQFGPPAGVHEGLAYGGWQEQKDQQGNVIRPAYAGYWSNLLELDVVIDHSWNKNSYLLKAEGRLKAPVLGVTHAPVNTMWGTPPPVDKPCITCISKDQASHVNALFERDARVAYNGIDLNHYKQLDIPRTDRFLFLARFSTIKGPHLAIEVCQRADKEIDLIGDTTITQEPQYFEMCKRMCDGNKTRIIGGVSRGETVYWYSKAKALLHLNRDFREPFGLAPIEAMACGCPVIAWKRGAMMETVKQGVSGFLVNSLEEAIDLLKTDAVASIDRNKCREWASQWSIENMVSGYDRLVNEAVNTGGW